MKPRSCGSHSNTLPFFPEYKSLSRRYLPAFVASNVRRPDSFEPRSSFARKWFTFSYFWNCLVNFEIPISRLERETYVPRNVLLGIVELLADWKSKIQQNVHTANYQISRATWNNSTSDSSSTLELLMFWPSYFCQDQSKWLVPLKDT